MSMVVPARPAGAIALLIAAFVVMAVFSREQPQSANQSSHTIATLVSDPIALDTALTRCNQSSASVEDPECRSVRAALARLAQGRRVKSVESDRRAQQQAQMRFEQQREALRQLEDGRHNAAPRKEVTDPYSLPFIPPESPGTPKPLAPAPASIQSPPEAVADARPAAQVAASDSDLTPQ